MKQTLLDQIPDESDVVDWEEIYAEMKKRGIGLFNKGDHVNTTYFIEPSSDMTSYTLYSCVNTTKNTFTNYVGAFATYDDAVETKEKLEGMEL